MLFTGSVSVKRDLVQRQKRPTTECVGDEKEARTEEEEEVTLGYSKRVGVWNAYGTRRYKLGPCAERVFPYRALCLPTLFHFLSVHKTSFSLTHFPPQNCA
jgi:hypothetical protein